MSHLSKKSICLVVLCLVISSFAFSWTIYQRKDVFGDYNGEYYLYDKGISIEITDSYLGGGKLRISFGSSEYGYYQADYYSIQLKEVDGTVHSYRQSSYILTGYDAIEVYDILLRNATTKVYVYYSYGYGDSFTFEVNPNNLSEGIEKLIQLSNLSSDIQGTLNKDFKGDDGEEYSLQISTNPSPNIYDFLVAFTVMKYSSDSKFAAMYITGDLGTYSSDKQYNTLEIKSGDREETFSRKSTSYTLIKKTDLNRLDNLLIGEETTISLPEYNISLNIPTDELRSLLGLSSIADKKMEDAVKMAEEKEAEAKAEAIRQSFKFSSSLSILVGPEPSVTTSTEELPGSESDEGSSSVLYSLKYTQMLFKFIYAAAAVDGSIQVLGDRGFELGLTADLGIGFKYLHFGARIPIRFQFKSSSLVIIPPQFFIEGFVPLEKGGVVFGASMSIENTNKNARGFIYLGYSLKTKEGTFATWGYKKEDL